MSTPEAPATLDFIRQIVADDLKSGKHHQPVTRFPPEPNGFLHIGHAKAICLNFGIGVENHSPCHLRFDDTNPSKEESEYVESIKCDVNWLGFTWGDNLFYASDYFDRLYDYALQLIKLGKAYVCQLSADEIREYRGTLTESGRESPWRNRSVEENLLLFEEMRAGKYPEGSHVLRLKIDMAASNINLRDPVIYRILFAHHHRTGDKWCIYPMYDYTHCLSDAIEGITHSLCTLEFEDHRPLYDWVLETLQTPCHPRQIEFARLNLTYTVMSKRKLLQLVKEGYVEGWDDPRMLTISGLRRRGYTPSSIRKFCQAIGIGKRESWIDMSILEDNLRDDLNPVAPRLMCVLKPVKLIIDNYPAGQTEMLAAQNHPQDPAMGTRQVPFGRELYIERDDFMTEPAKKFHRLAPGKEVRLRYAYIVTCTSFVTGAHGEITEIHCQYDPASRGGDAGGRKVKGTIHWVAADTAFDCQVYLYDRLFSVPHPDADKDVDFKTHLNPNSRLLIEHAKGEPALREVQSGVPVQFERNGYFSADPVLSKPGQPVFNRAVTLRDSWVKG